MLDVDGPNIYVSTLDGTEGIMSFAYDGDEHFFYGSDNILYMNEFSSYRLTLDVPSFRGRSKKVRVL